MESREGLKAYNQDPGRKAEMMASRYSLATWLAQVLPNEQQTQVLSILTLLIASMLKLQFQHYTISPIFSKRRTVGPSCE